MDNSVLVKGKIWTADNSTTFCEAFFVENGKITKTGKVKDVEEYAVGHDYKVFDYGENLVMPGMTDAHIHATAYAKLALYVDLTNTKCLDEIGSMIKNKAKELPEGAWIRAVNFNEDSWDVPLKPDLNYLDALELNNPIIVSRYCGHFHAVNTLALKMSGLWDVSDPNIARDENGQQMGQLREGAAGPVIEAVADYYEKPEYITKLIKNGCLKLASHGITALHACDAPSYALGEDLAACQQLLERNELPIRWGCYCDKLPNYKIKSGFGNDMLFFAGLKLFADGTLGGRTCGLEEAFADDENNVGSLNHSDEEMYALISEAHKRGINVQVHAIGDRAIMQTLNAMERTINQLGEPAVPYRINHAIVCSCKILERIKKGRFTIDIQPVQAHTDRKMAPLRVGPERMKFCYPFQSLYQSSYTVTGSSDAPVEDPNPWLGIWTAVTLSEMNSRPLAQFNHEQRLTLDQALLLYTANPWKALGKESEFGTISEGKRADFTVVDGNPFSKNVANLKDTEHLATFVEGNMIWEKKQ